MKQTTPWITAALILVVLFGTIYAVVQQSQRLDANEPQIQLAEDVASSLNGGTQPSLLVNGAVNMRQSSAPFIIIYTRSGIVAAGSGFLDGKIPIIPIGVLRAANNKPYHFVTWQPANDVRIAAVSVSANNYYVLSGRLLTEVEKDEVHTFQLSSFGCLLALSLLTGGYYVNRTNTKHRK